MSKSADSGAFFFPTLLASTATEALASIFSHQAAEDNQAATSTQSNNFELSASKRESASNKEQWSSSKKGTTAGVQIANVPDIDVVGVNPEPMDDFEFLRSILT